MGQLQNLLTKVGETASFLGPEIQAIPDEKFERFLSDPVLIAWNTALKKSDARNRMCYRNPKNGYSRSQFRA